MTDARPAAPRCILFDLDGTLVDSAPDLGHAANLVRAESGLEPLPAERYRPQASNGARGLLRVALGLTPEHPEYEARKTAFLAYYEANLTTHTTLFDGVVAMLAALDGAGLPWGIVTNKAARFAEPVVARLGFAATCRCLIAGDTTPHPKPAPDGLLLAASRIGVEAAACVYVGDDRRDIVAARAAGMTAVAAGWGYLGEGQDVSTWQADAVVPTPAALFDWVGAARALR